MQGLSTAIRGAPRKGRPAMSRLMEWINSHFVPDRAVRAAAWALGARHRGEVSQGARAEIRLPDRTAAQRTVLRAVLRGEARKARPPGRTPPRATRGPK